MISDEHAPSMGPDQGDHNDSPGDHIGHGLREFPGPSREKRLAFRLLVPFPCRLAKKMRSA
jgi:hypothetical protein